MATEIPQGTWHDFLTDFTRDNEGRKATLQFGDKHIGDTAKGDDVLALTGIESGVMAEDDDTIVVELADLQGEQQMHVTHRIEDVDKLIVRDHDGLVDAVEIDTRDGTHAVLELGEEIPAMKK